MMFQDPYPSLNPRMKVAQILAEPLLIQQRRHNAQHRPARPRAADVRWVSTRVAADRYPHEFSGGQRQRIGLAAPWRSTRVDRRRRARVGARRVDPGPDLNLMKDLQDVHNLCYVMVTHDLAVVYYMADSSA